MPDIYFTNTLTRKMEKFVPIKDGEVGIYSCGPTVYGNQHIGNMYAFTQWDILTRFLRHVGYRVKWVMNITDVGHMTSDEDAGDDKMEKGAKRENITVWDIADKYIAQFKDSLELLNINMPDVLCRATEHIPEQIDLIKKIEANGFTYMTKTGLVFDTGKFPGYADFARLNLEKQIAGSRVEVDPEKKKPWDFLLWVTNQPEHVMKWESPWGVGFPGWHIECTAMSVKYLGERFDIHTGGKEHIPIHHTNEVAQGFGAYGHQTANYWLHNEWFTIDNNKISKSLGNTITVQDLVKRGLDPMVLKYLIFNSHYRQGMNFSDESFKQAENALKNLRSIMTGLKTSSRTTLSSEKNNKVDQFQTRFIDALADDLNISKALAILWEMLKSNIPSEDKYDLALSFDEVFGLGLGETKIEAETPEEVGNLIKERDEARKNKDFTKSDELRKNIEELGYLVKDTPEGTKVVSS
jgi:cysteinyl-tRNA synthetase